MQQPKTPPKLLVGVEAFTAFIFGEEEVTPSNVRRMRHWIDTGKVPAGKLGGRYIGDPALIEKTLAEVTAGGAK
jgi:hypothetical protein